MSYHNPTVMVSDGNNQGRPGVTPAFIPSQGMVGQAGGQGAVDGGVAARSMQYQAANPDALGGLVNHFNTLGMANSNMHQGPAALGLPPNSYLPADNPPVVYSGFGGHNYNLTVPQLTETFPPGGQFLPQGNVPGTYGPFMVPYTPNRPVAYNDRVDRGGLRDVPGLDNRRASYSTTATESTPGTPFFGATSDRHNIPRVISADRSSYTTPSPQQFAVSGVIGSVTTKGKRVAEAELQALVEQDPPIPSAVPAVFTTPEQRKTLEQCLENRIEGNKNVYIRGLHPTTDDELLSKYAARFGEVEQSKAIIDTATGACKGFGFAKFKDVRDSEKCIQGFYLLGYEVGFARESFNARLKAEGDEGSTNLYISNLPKSITEAQLVAIFEPYQILSSKILRDSMGNSRGVGFARFESRDVCEEIIKRFHGQAIGDECFLMQVRYADTPAQKELKRITAERRQYRTNEYNIGAYGTMAVGINPSIYNTQGNWNRSPRFSERADRTHYRNILATKTGNAHLVPGLQQEEQGTVPTSPNDGSADEGVTVAGTPTNHKSHSSPVAKKETA